MLHSIDAPCRVTQIKIEILDVNDHAPEFPQRRLRQRIAESTDPQSGGIAVPAASDPDAGRNAVHKYEIYSGHHQRCYRLETALVWRRNVSVRS